MSWGSISQNFLINSRRFHVSSKMSAERKGTYAKLFLLALIAFLPSLISHHFISIANQSLSAVIELLLSGSVGLYIYLWLGGLMKIEALTQVRQPLARGWKRLTGARGQSGNQ